MTNWPVYNDVISPDVGAIRMATFLQEEGLNGASEDMRLGCWGGFQAVVEVGNDGSVEEATRLGLSAFTADEASAARYVALAVAHAASGTFGEVVSGSTYAALHAQRGRIASAFASLINARQGEI